MDAGLDAHGFIQELAHAPFPPLEWGDYAETYMDDWQSKTTPFEDMKTLFRCEGFGQIKTFSLKNTAYTKDQLRELVALRPKLPVRVVRSSHHYAD